MIGPLATRAGLTEPHRHQWYGWIFNFHHKKWQRRCKTCSKVYLSEAGFSSDPNQEPAKEISDG